MQGRGVGTQCRLEIATAVCALKCLMAEDRDTICLARWRACGKAAHMGRYLRRRMQTLRGDRWRRVVSLAHRK